MGKGIGKPDARVKNLHGGGGGGGGELWSTALEQGVHKSL